MQSRLRRILFVGGGAVAGGVTGGAATVGISKAAAVTASLAVVVRFKSTTAMYIYIQLAIQYSYTYLICKCSLRVGSHSRLCWWCCAGGRWRFVPNMEAACN